MTLVARVRSGPLSSGVRVDARCQLWRTELDPGSTASYQPIEATHSSGRQSFRSSAPLAMHVVVAVSGEPRYLETQCCGGPPAGGFEPYGGGGAGLEPAPGADDCPCAGLTPGCAGC